ncbi:2-oxoglutarate-Fe(II) type oxidoreductase isoform X1 [Olea europaea subsp. europaea]|uniref:2-oxoglutarate-Fe(II) type oxidoreductase isoform X1 n=1 Tax=Olea europaea subsp. europaea TaxID=158383 RepID=A0A8S0U3J9_OLEEU|nr:2-oxoglutarate-Fe(II) type oxidoreductase isoform X1 [Olea europaea subsp. europaea]
MVGFIALLHIQWLWRVVDAWSTLHRVMPTGQTRYSMAFFLDPNPDCVVECLETCCSESYPPRFPPIRSGDYMEERFKLTYGS